MNKQEKMEAVNAILAQLSEIVSDGIEMVGEEEACHQGALDLIKQAIELYEDPTNIGGE